MSSLPHVLVTKEFICKSGEKSLLPEICQIRLDTCFLTLGNNSFSDLINFLINDLSELSVISSHFDSNF